MQNVVRESRQHADFLSDGEVDFEADLYQQPGQAGGGSDSSIDFEAYDQTLDWKEELDQVYILRQRLDEDVRKLVHDVDNERQRIIDAASLHAQRREEHAERMASLQQHAAQLEHARRNAAPLHLNGYMLRQSADHDHIEPSTEQDEARFLEAAIQASLCLQRIESQQELCSTSTILASPSRAASYPTSPRHLPLAEPPRPHPHLPATPGAGGSGIAATALGDRIALGAQAVSRGQGDAARAHPTHAHAHTHTRTHTQAPSHSNSARMTPHNGHTHTAAPDTSATELVPPPARHPRTLLAADIMQHTLPSLPPRPPPRSLPQDGSGGGGRVSGLEQLRHAADILLLPSPAAGRSEAWFPPLFSFFCFPCFAAAIILLTSSSCHMACGSVPCV